MQAVGFVGPVITSSTRSVLEVLYTSLVLLIEMWFYHGVLKLVLQCTDCTSCVLRINKCVCYGLSSAQRQDVTAGQMSSSVNHQQSMKVTFNSESSRLVYKHAVRYLCDILQLLGILQQFVSLTFKLYYTPLSHKQILVNISTLYEANYTCLVLKKTIGFTHLS